MKKKPQQLIKIEAAKKALENELLERKGGVRYPRGIKTSQAYASLAYLVRLAGLAPRAA